MLEEAVDIMAPRRKANDAFNYMSRLWVPQNAYNTVKQLTPQELKQVVLNSKYMDSILEAESYKNGKSKADIRKQVENILEEIGLDRKMYVIRWLGAVFIKTSLMMKIGLFINERNVFKLKSTLGTNPVLFLPTHRSYADFCVMHYICFHYNIQLPAVAAGTDFQSMVVVGRAMREAGGFYMRRTLQGEPIYAATFSEYVRTLTQLYHLPIEFFLEGTRSRGNKPVVPKYGLLSMVLTPLFRGSIPDITIVPISMNYDRVLEESLFAYEHCGLPKPRETTSGLLRAFNILNDHFGHIYIHIGEPFSARQYFNNDLKNSTEELLQPSHLQTLNTEQFKLVQKLAHEVVALQMNMNYMSSFNLIAIILMKYLINKEVLAEKTFYEELVELADVFKIRMSSNIKEEVKRVLHVHRSWVAFHKGNLKLIISAPVLMNNDIRKKMKGAQLKSETLSLAVPIIQLQLYINPAMHLIIPQALISRIVQITPNITKDELYEIYKNLRSILKYEFFYVEEHEYSIYEQTLEFCISNKVLLRRDTDISFSIGTNSKMLNLLDVNVWPALLCAKVSAEVMLEFDNIEQRSAAAAIQSKFEPIFLVNSHPYCLSLEAINNCLQGLASYGALIKDRNEKTTTFTPIKTELYKVINILEEVTPNLAMHLDKSNPVILDSKNTLIAKL